MLAFLIESFTAAAVVTGTFQLTGVHCQKRYAFALLHIIRFVCFHVTFCHPHSRGETTIQSADL